MFFIARILIESKIMKIQFLGATQGVTGSKFLITVNHEQFLIDCGLFQGLKALRLKNWEPPCFKPDQIKAVILTHAHIDHSGYLPLLVRNGFSGKIYSTQGTLDLCKILLPDAGYLQEEEARYANKKNFSKHHPAEPLFTVDDAWRVLDFFTPKQYHQSFEISPGLKVTFKSAGHIIGSASVSIEYEGKTVVFSGDLGRYNDVVMLPPEDIHQVDTLVMESTYGNRLHEQTDPQDQLAEIVKRTVLRKGVLVIPAFAVGRAQVILHLLLELKKSGRIPHVPLYLNSPMSVKATQIFCDYLSEHKLTKTQCQNLQENVICIHSPEESKSLNEQQGPMIIVSASGMATGGRVVHHIKSFCGDAKNTILFVGFQAAGTRGEALLNGAQDIKIHGVYHPVRAEIARLDSLSAHADADELVKWASTAQSKPKNVFLVHGEPSSQDALRLKLADKLGWNHVVIPSFQDTFEI